MDDVSMVGVIIFFAAIILSRIISERALWQLSPEQKLSIIDSFSKMRMYNLIPLAVIIGAFFLAEHVMPFHSILPYTTFLLALLAFVVVTQAISYKKLKALQLPDNYLKTYFSAQMIVMLSFIAWIGISVYPIIFRT